MRRSSIAFAAGVVTPGACAVGAGSAAAARTDGCLSLTFSPPSGDTSWVETAAAGQPASIDGGSSVVGAHSITAFALTGESGHAGVWGQDVAHTGFFGQDTFLIAAGSLLKR